MIHSNLLTAQIIALRQQLFESLMIFNRLLIVLYVWVDAFSDVIDTFCTVNLYG